MLRRGMDCPLLLLTMRPFPVPHRAGSLKSQV
jgi:hypothetical protein